MEIRNAAQAQYYYRLGVRDYALGTDLRILKDYYKQEREKLKTLIQEEAHEGAGDIQILWEAE